MTPYIPLIDISPLYSNNQKQWNSVAQQIDEACQQSGFFYVTGHNISAQQIEKVMALAKCFFSQTSEEKLKIDITATQHHRGYGAIATEQLDPERPGDFKETFDMARNLDLASPEVLAGTPLHGPNQYPDIEGFAEVMEEHYQLMLELGKMILKGISVALGIEPNYFESRFTHPISVLRFLHYPPFEEKYSDEQLGAGAHTDYGCITLLYQDDSGGLQVRNRAGKWIDAPPIEGSFVINIGDMMARWSNDRYCSTPHRVINPEGKERYSSPFFVEPNFDTDIYCLQGCTTPENPPKYPAISAGNYLLSRFQETYAYRQEIS